MNQRQLRPHYLGNALSKHNFLKQLIYLDHPFMFQFAFLPVLILPCATVLKVFYFTFVAISVLTLS